MQPSARALRTRVRRSAKPAAEVVARIVGRERLRRTLRPARFGTLRRLEPLSRRYGRDRGTSIDRHYLDAFFASHASDISGRVLEVGGPTYTTVLGRAVTRLDIVDIDPRNDDATIVADLADERSLPAEAFDCIVLPQTLQYVADLDAAVANLWQALAPGGVLLVSVPAVSKVDHHLAAVDSWRLLPTGLDRLLRRGCPGASVDVSGFGNVLTAVAFLAGAAAEELRASELDALDAEFPVVSCGRVRKP